MLFRFIIKFSSRNDILQKQGYQTGGFMNLSKVSHNPEPEPLNQRPIYFHA